MIALTFKQGLFAWFIIWIVILGFMAACKRKPFEDDLEAEWQDEIARAKLRHPSHVKIMRAIDIPLGPRSGPYPRG